MMRIPILIFALIIGLGSTEPVFTDTYRGDMPPVLPAPNKPGYEDSALFNAFSERYAARQSPRVALFWNRELTAVLERTNQRVERTDSSTRNSETETNDKTSGEAGSNALRELEGLRRGSSVKVVTEGDVDDNQREQLDTKTDTLLRTAFTGVLSAAGVRFVDRALMMRTIAIRDDVSEAQTAEMRGLLGQADLLVEVLLVRDEYAPLDYGFRVAVKDLASSSAVAEFYTQAHPQIHYQRRFIAVDGGFEREPAPETTIQDIGYSLARQTMAELIPTL